MTRAEEFAAWVRDHHWTLTLGGKRHESLSGESFQNWSPVTEGCICEIPDGNVEDVELAVELGRRASREWATVPARDRARAVRELARVAREHAEELALLDAIDVGNAFSLMLRDVEAGADGMDFMADAAHHLSGAIYGDQRSHLHYSRYEPFGVVARIIAFNHPIMFALQKIAAPLVAGNAVILKPSEHSPLSALRMGELFDGMLPDGLLSVLVGRGIAVPDAIVRHPEIRRIGFIGSEPVGRAIQRAAAEVTVKDVTLELGGKNAIIVCDDVDVRRAAAGVVKGMNFTGWQSQSCSSTSRLLVAEAIADDLLEEVMNLVRKIRIGDPLDPETQMGTMATRDQYDKTVQFIAQAERDGVRLVSGGQPSSSRQSPGLFVEPTIFDRVDQASSLATQEVFGPVLSVFRWADIDEAIALANELPYGLTGAVWTNDAQQSHRLAHALDAGFVWVNDAASHFTGVPFGGFKSSGIGKEESVEELLSYSRVKVVNYALK